MRSQVVFWPLVVEATSGPVQCEQIQTPAGTPAIPRAIFVLTPTKTPSQTVPDQKCRTFLFPATIINHGHLSTWGRCSRCSRWWPPGLKRCLRERNFSPRSHRVVRTMLNSGLLRARQLYQCGWWRWKKSLSFPCIGPKSVIVDAP